MKNITSLLLTLLYLPLYNFSQQGPAGVGATDGTSTLKYWLDASRGFATAPSITWADQSGKGVTNTVTGSPFLTPSFLNGRDIVTFNRNDGADFFTSNMSLNAGAFPQSDIYAVYYTNGTSTVGGIWGEDNGGWDRFMFAHSGPGCPYSVSIGAGCASNPAMFPPNAAVITSVHLDEDAISGSTVQVNGTTVLSFTANHAPQPSNDFSVGSIGDGGPTYALNGSIAEVIVFGSARNSAERIMINNYLSAKYDIPLTANDVYVQDDVVNGNFDNNVAGIGRVDVSNLSNAGRGTGIVRISNPAGLDDNEFLMWGDNNGIMQATNNSDIPAGVQARFDRVWRGSELNASGVIVDVGAVDIQWDLTGYSPITASDLRLLVDTDNDNSFADETPISGATDAGGNIYQFAGVTAIEDSRRFTLGTANQAQTPLPVVLSFFTASPVNNNSVYLKWQTASENNNDYFEAERSKDLSNWGIIATVKGAVNSNHTINYIATDVHPYTGISYYRLKQVDLDGKIWYSGIRKVAIKETLVRFHVYPNPADQYLFIKGDISAKQDVAIFDQYGRNVSSLIGKPLYGQSQRLRINVSGLRQGVYFVRTLNGSSKFYKK
jgi:hypothetical protein